MIAVDHALTVRIVIADGSGKDPTEALLGLRPMRAVYNAASICWFVC